MSNARELAELGGAYATGGYPHFKNRIINGAMVIDQRNAGASVNPSNAQYTLDRWSFGITQTSKLTTQQNSGSVALPAGYTNYLGVVSSSAYSVTSSDYFYLNQRIEANNVSDLSYGTANAATVTLSFWVRSSLTGTFGGSVYNATGNKSYPFTYTIAATGTWEQKSVTVSGDTATALGTGTAIGLLVSFGLGAGATYSGTAGSWQSGLLLSATGATSVVGTSGATFYITGVQLEKGSTATSFDYRPYGTELALCQRYYLQQNYTQLNARVGSALGTGGGGVDGYMIPLPVAMRSSPTVVISNIGLYDGTSIYTISSYSSSYSTNLLASGNITASGSITAGKLIQLYCINSSGYYSASAEL